MMPSSLLFCITSKAPILYSAIIINASNEVNVSNELVVGGNLIVNGNITTVNSLIVTVEDPVLTLGGENDATSSDINSDRGIDFKYWDGTVGKLGFFGYDYSKDKLTFIKSATSGVFYSGTLGGAEFSEVTNTESGLNLTGNGNSFWSTTSGKINISELYFDCCKL